MTKDLQCTRIIRSRIDTINQILTTYDKRKAEAIFHFLLIMEKYGMTWFYNDIMQDNIVIMIRYTDRINGKSRSVEYAFTTDEILNCRLHETMADALRAYLKKQVNNTAEFKDEIEKSMR